MTFVSTRYQGCSVATGEAHPDRLGVLLADQPAVLVRRQYHGYRVLMAHHDLRSVIMRGLDQLAKALLRLCRLPLGHGPPAWIMDIIDIRSPFKSIPHSCNRGLADAGIRALD